MRQQSWLATPATAGRIKKSRTRATLAPPGSPVIFATSSEGLREKQRRANPFLAEPIVFSPPIDRQHAFRELRRRLGSEHLQRLGGRAIDEFFAEVGRAGGIEVELDILERLDRYRDRLTPEMLRAVGGDRFPERFTVLRGRRRR